MLKWIWTSRLSIENSLSLGVGVYREGLEGRRAPEGRRVCRGCASVSWVEVQGQDWMTIHLFPVDECVLNTPERHRVGREGASGAGFRVHNLWLHASGFGFRIPGFGFRGWGVNFARSGTNLSTRSVNTISQPA